MAERTLGSKTSPGFGNPEGAVRASDAEAARAEELAPPPAPRRSIAPRERVRAEGSGRPARAQRLLEVEIVQERGRTPRPDPLKRSFEVWTQNERRAAVARDKTGGVQPLRAVAFALQHGKSDQRLCPGEEDSLRIQTIFVVQPNFHQRHSSAPRRAFRRLFEPV
jgi:hypothetical protein